MPDMLLLLLFFSEFMAHEHTRPTRRFNAFFCLAGLMNMGNGDGSNIRAEASSRLDCVTQVGRATG